LIFGKYSRGRLMKIRVVCTTVKVDRFGIDPQAISRSLRSAYVSIVAEAEFVDENARRIDTAVEVASKVRLIIFSL